MENKEHRAFFELIVILLLILLVPTVINSAMELTNNQRIPYLLEIMTLFVAIIMILYVTYQTYSLNRVNRKEAGRKIIFDLLDVYATDEMQQSVQTLHKEFDEQFKEYFDEALEAEEKNNKHKEFLTMLVKNDFALELNEDFVNKWSKGENAIHYHRILYFWKKYALAFKMDSVENSILLGSFYEMCTFGKLIPLYLQICKSKPVHCKCAQNSLIAPFRAYLNNCYPKVIAAATQKPQPEPVAEVTEEKEVVEEQVTEAKDDKKEEKGKAKKEDKKQKEKSEKKVEDKKKDVKSKDKETKEEKKTKDTKEDKTEKDTKKKDKEVKKKDKKQNKKKSKSKSKKKK